MSRALQSEEGEGRIHSPSSINTYRQCPRKYFYRYIAKLPTSTSIHLLRGSIVHKVLEDIYDIDVSPIPDATFPITIRMILQELFRKEWERTQEELVKLGFTDDELRVYFDETRTMINNFFHYLIDRLTQSGGCTKETFLQLRPQREVLLLSEKHRVRGFADAIHNEGGKLFILDYKTSSKADITDEYLLQLSIYSMIAEEIGKRPDEVGIFFLKHGRELRVQVTDELVERARIEVNFVHEQTRSKDIKDYPKRPGPLCKWSTGQCDFYDTCWSKTLLEYDETPDDLIQIGK